ncbi:ROK family protein [Alkalimarinus sediminis]|uniref:ROK family protein n=1 Tax=Alkalimarinus sediminis TaxID=1632866 RepID=A0A9E8KPA8_9ALTE|nr:ROK family protein [Alkalimarinus sediminis]UZW73282.1 ROK family protein [Alkalimarinus sediminis]
MRFGIDLGGTKIEIIALAEGNKEVYRKRLPTPKNAYHQTLDTITTLVQQAESALTTTGTVGIGIPGTLSPDHGRVKNANSVCLIGQDLQHDLEARLSREVRIANDADCFTLSEASDGAGADYHTVFGVILGTGVGGGISVNKTLLTGPNAITGEWGHNPLPWVSKQDLPLPECYCGKHGCIETFLSGPRFNQHYFSLTGQNLPPADIIAMLGKDDNADRAFTAYIDRLGRALATVINILDPEAIVLGGGMSNIEKIYPQVQKIWSSYVFSDKVNTKLLKALHGDSSGVRGAAWLWHESSTN